METPPAPSLADAPPSRLRILVLTDTAILGLGGSEGFLRRLIGRLPADRFHFDVLQLAREPAAGQRIGQPPGPSTTLHYLPVRAAYGPDGVAAWRLVRRLIRNGDYDVVQSQHEKSDLIAALVPQGRHRFRRISNRRDMGFHKSRKLRWLMRYLNRRFDRIVAPSATILESLMREDAVDPRRCVCIRNGVDTDRFAPADPTRRNDLRARFGYGPQHLLIGCAARFWQVKRHEDLLHAFAQVLARVPDARLVLVGEGPERSLIERVCTELGIGPAVNLLGARTDMPEILPAFDAFALTSSSEGLSNAILEAQACGLPVVATRVGGNPELVDESCGVLVPAFDPKAVAQALTHLLQDEALRHQLGSVARERVVRHHSLASMLDTYAALYRELCDVR